jgi:glycosyltransferase involved in cell wall biosynthesis
MGGVEKASCTLANALCEAGYQMKYLALIPENPFFTLLDEVEYSEPIGFNERTMSLLKTLRFIRKHIIEYKPQEIIAFTKFYASLANLALVGTKYKVIFSERSSPFYKWPGYIDMFCKLSITLKKPKAIISQTLTASVYQKKFYGNVPYYVIPNIIQPPILYPGIQREPFILCVGRFNDSCKGFDLMVQSFNILSNKNWELHFAGGDVEEAESLIKLIKPERRNNVKFLGKINPVDQLYARAGIFVIPSRIEGFPNALAEAMSAGVPSISFDFVAGPRDIIKENEDGIIVEKENVYALAQAIDSLIDNEFMRNKLSQNAMVNSIKFNKSSVIMQYKAILN